MKALRSLAAVAFAAAIGTGLFYALLAPVNRQQEQLRSKANAASRDIEALEARIRTLNASKSGIKFPPQLLWRATTGNEAALALQDSLLQLARTHQLSILTFGTASVSKKTGQKTTAVTLEGESTLERFYQFLNAVENLEPRVAPALLRIRPRALNRSELEGTGIYFQTTIWAFWEPDT